MTKAERRVLITENASVIRAALSLVLGLIKSEADVTPGTRDTLQRCAQCDRLVLDLRTAKGLPCGISPGVRNLRASQVGNVLVVNGEVTSLQILQQVQELRHRHFLPEKLTFVLRHFVHALF